MIKCDQIFVFKFGENLKNILPNPMLAFHFTAFFFVVVLLTFILSIWLIAEKRFSNEPVLLNKNDVLERSNSVKIPK